MSEMTGAGDRATAGGITVSDAPTAEESQRVQSGLGAFNLAAVGASNRRALAALFRPADGAPVEAGLSGYTAWDWLYVEKLWVAEDFRGRGIAGALLAAAEAEAQARGCKAAWIDTFNPSAHALYVRCGYAVFGQLPDFAAGRTRVFLQKRFS